MATLKYRLVLFCVFAAGFGVFYTLPNFYPLEQPSYLPLYQVDRWTPFLPWTFSIYVSEYILAVLAVLMIRDLEEFNSFARMMFMTLIFCGTFFWFFPTTYPRPPYPEMTTWFDRFFMDMVLAADKPNNCFPSMHVALIGVATWAVRGRGPAIFLLFCLWSVLIFISTLTTKQHYFVDVVGGLCVVVSVSAIEWAFFAKGFIRDRFYKRFLIPKG